jgi:hypothetical protein
MDAHGREVMDARQTRPSPGLEIGVKAAIFSLDAQAHLSGGSEPPKRLNSSPYN